MDEKDIGVFKPDYTEEIEVIDDKIPEPKVETVVVPDDAELPKVDIKAFAPLIVTLITFIGTFCVTVLGWEPLPYSSEDINYGVVITLQVASTVWAWFRNNNVTKHGRRRQAVADQVVPESRKEADKL